MNLFGDDEKPPRKARTPRRLDPYYDAIARLIGPVAAAAAAGRVMKLAKQIADSNLSPDALEQKLPAVVARYASWRKVIDLAAVTSCWPWIITPPRPTPADSSGSPLIDAWQAMALNGGERPH